jgi:hypothetical protein
MLRATLLRLHFAALLALTALASAAPALAQQGGACQDFQTILVERRTLGEQLGKAKGKDGKLDPRASCPILTKMVTNGETGMKWFEGNKDWCQVPDQFVESFSGDHDKVKTVRTQACQIAAKINEMEKQARAQQQQQGGAGGKGGLLGGNTLSGEYKIPRGAL